MKLTKPLPSRVLCRSTVASASLIAASPASAASIAISPTTVQNEDGCSIPASVANGRAARIGSASRSTSSAGTSRTAAW